MTSPVELKPNPDPTPIILDNPEAQGDEGYPSWSDTAKDFLGREVRYLANPWNIGTGICVVAGVVSSVAIVAFLGIAALAIAAMTLITLGAAGVFFLVHARRAEKSRELHVHLNKLHEAIEGNVDISFADRAMGFIGEHKSSHTDFIEKIEENLKLIKHPSSDSTKVKEFQKSILQQIADLKGKLHPIRDHVKDYVEKLYKKNVA